VVVSPRHDRRRRVTLALLVVTSLALVSLDERGSGLIDSARTAAQDVVAPVQHLADDAINPVADWLDGLGRASELQDENARLRRDLDAARSEIAAAKGSLARLDEVEQILDLPDVADADGVVADVVTQGADNFSRTFRISKGSSSGIVKDMPVVVGATSAGGRARSALVGRIASVSRASAIVERIDDANFGVGAQLVQGTGFGPKGTAAGQRNSNLLRFSVIGDSPSAVVLKRGDVVVTLGSLLAKYPAGLVVGTVVHEVGVSGAVARDAEVRPVVDLNSLTVVKVLKYPPAPVP
jgi:rod shape-determining protein MreC